MWLLNDSTTVEAQALLSRATPEQVNAFDARDPDSSSIEMTVAGGVATIPVKGLMTEKVDFMAWLFGGGNPLYSDIDAALIQADADKNVKSIVLAIDSPGGEAKGLFSTLDVLAGIKKPVETLVGGMAASAAYGLASATSKITASSKLSEVGSIGTVVTMYLDEDSVDITSTKAPNKAPDINTEAGKAVVQERLDGFHNLFVDAIASGRGVPEETVNTNFGQGAVYLAEKALTVGMIDAIGASAKPKTKEGVTKMDSTTLKAEHPKCFADVLAQGVAQERDRVGAMAVAGKASGATALALESIESGVEMTETLRAQFMFFKADGDDVNATQKDSDEATGALKETVPETAEAKQAEQDALVKASVFSKLGVVGV